MALRGVVDDATRDRVSGWAQDPAAPETPVSLLITVNDILVARVLADRMRPDLQLAGLGSGRHSFDVALKGLSPLQRHVIAVRREDDGMHLRNATVVIEPATAFDPACRTQFAALLAEITDGKELDDSAAFLLDQAERLIQSRTDRHSRRAQRLARPNVKWQCDPPSDRLPPRALFIDERAPDARRDAGSNALLSHMRSLHRLGFEVNFAAADMQANCVDQLESAGIMCCYTPRYGSVEEVLRREAHSFDLVYLHRGAIAVRYLALARFYQPKARLVFSVADLHHLRLARQAEAENRPELLPLARRLQAGELRAAAAADVVITHSTYEAALLAQHLPATRVRVVPWSVPLAKTPVGFADRGGVGFVGHYAHAPNLDAAQWLIDEIMPRVRASRPAITCLLAGSEMPDVLRRAAPGVAALGQVTDLAEVFDRVRLTVAPIAYGAGVKGKVLVSLAAGIPCVGTPAAIEGLELPPLLQSLVADDTAGLAETIIRLHDDEALNVACSKCGLDYAATALSEARIDALMRDVAALPIAGSAMLL